MARSFAAVYHRIWADPSWRSLDVDAQHLYLLLISQDNLNLAGVLPLQIRKWSKCVHGWDETVVGDALDRLRADHFVIMDDDTEEVLVRTFVRNSGAYKTPGMLTSILKFAESIHSPGLRRVLAVELGKLDPLEGKTAAKGEAAIDATRTILDPSGGPSGPGGEPIPDGIGDGIGDAFVGTHRGYLPNTSAEPIGDGIGDTSITSTGTGTSLSLVRNQGGEGTSPHPPRCAKHDELSIGDEPPCGACKRLRENWETTRTEAAKPKPRPKWCGGCDERTRMVEAERGMKRCPDCHPIELRARQAAGA